MRLSGAMKSKRISDGQCAAYGREGGSDYVNMSLWRNRLHNEMAGMPLSDLSGANTGVSLLWCPGSGLVNEYALKSQKRRSELKQIQDFGRLAPAPQLPPAVSASGSETLRSAAHSPRGLSELQMSRDGVPDRGSFLGTESERLQAVAHARNLGQTFLRAGNLRQAKIYLAHAEKLLQVDPKHRTAEEETLDEFRESQKKGTWKGV